ncbi:uncharacterized protein BXZ73DRAFT_101743 [Epithele typhae]|uniref:uncharacterized protein n=1 Tax=Epithele typhae TaxID=378194 RepID=UPI002007C10F|nr:uncharacterized protein BXZ73DRAFT_101743 [Epithele typhae]KAH9931161.1 hypothetical protein BXZ73DRAFT_101743 [Epithele typhae]
MPRSSTVKSRASYEREAERTALGAEKAQLQAQLKLILTVHPFFVGTVTVVVVTITNRRTSVRQASTWPSATTATSPRDHTIRHDWRHSGQASSNPPLSNHHQDKLDQVSRTTSLDDHYADATSADEDRASAEFAAHERNYGAEGDAGHVADRAACAILLLAADGIARLQA